MDNNSLFHIIDSLKVQSNLYLKLTFSKKIKSRDGRLEYKSYTPNMSTSIKQEILQLALSDIDHYRGKNLAEYNPVGCLDETYEVIDLDKYRENNIDLYYESINHADYVDTSIDPSDLTFYAISIEGEIDGKNRSIIFFRRLSKFKRLQSKGVIAYFSGNTLNKLDAKIFGIDGTVDMVKVDNKLYIFNHISIERIFDMSNTYDSMTTEALRILKESERIENFEIFEEDCKNDMRVKRALTKMMKESNELESVFNYFDNIKKTIDMFELDIRIVEEEKPMIIYEDKSQLLDFLRIIRDSYYTSVIKERNGIDERA